MVGKEGADKSADIGGGPSSEANGSAEGRAFGARALSQDLVLHKKLLLLLHMACSEVRYFVGTMPSERIFDLADAVEFIPETMLNWYPDAEEVILATMRDYQKKYKGQGGFDYVALLTMDEHDFRRDCLREGYEPDLNDPQLREFIYGPGTQ